MIAEKDVTIVVPHFGASPEQCYSLKECLNSLYETCGINVVVVKNGPACQCARDIRVVEQGQCRAVNVGVAATNTPWVMVTNDDMIYPPHWFDKLTDDMKMNEQETLCASPQLVEPRPGAPTFDVFFAGGAGGDFNKKLFLEYVENCQEVDMVRPGFNLPFLIKRDLWDLVGGYDINYDPWGSNSDSDLVYKIKLAGVQPYQTTSCKVYHFSQTSGTFEPRNDSFRFRNYGYFREKWGFERTDIGIWEATFEIPTVEQGRVFTPKWEGKYGY